MTDRRQLQRAESRWPEWGTPALAGGMGPAVLALMVLVSEQWWLLVVPAAWSLAFQVYWWTFREDAVGVPPASQPLGPGAGQMLDLATVTPEQVEARDRMAQQLRARRRQAEALASALGKNGGTREPTEPSETASLERPPEAPPRLAGHLPGPTRRRQRSGTLLGSVVTGLSLGGVMLCMQILVSLLLVSPGAFVDGLWLLLPVAVAVLAVATAEFTRFRARRFWARYEAEQATRGDIQPALAIPEVVRNPLAATLSRQARVSRAVTEGGRGEGITLLAVSIISAAVVGLLFWYFFGMNADILLVIGLVCVVLVVGVLWHGYRRRVVQLQRLETGRDRAHQSTSAPSPLPGSPPGRFGGMIVLLLIVAGIIAVLLVLAWYSRPGNPAPVAKTAAADNVPDNRAASATSSGGVPAVRWVMAEIGCYPGLCHQQALIVPPDRETVLRLRLGHPTLVALETEGIPELSITLELPGGKIVTGQPGTHLGTYWLKVDLPAGWHNVTFKLNSPTSPTQGILILAGEAPAGD